MADTATTPSRFRAARPAVAVGGRDEPNLAIGMANFLVAEDLLGLYRCEAVFGNWGAAGGGTGFLYFGRDLLDFGKPFSLRSGDSTLFSGRITGLEGQFPDSQPPRIGVLAEDRFQDLRMTRRTRTFADLSDKDLFTQLAGNYGLKADVSVDGPTHRLLAQVNQSDLAFLRERARSIDAEVWVDDDTLRAKSRSARTGPAVELSYRSGLREFSVLADLAGQRTSLAVSGWDVAGKSVVKYEANDSAVSSEFGGGDSGAALLKSALGERKEVVAHTVPFAAAEARAEAEARFRRTARRFVVGRGVADPAVRVRAGTTVNLTGLGPLFSGHYYVSEVRVLFDGTDLWTEFTAERPALGKPA